MHIHGTQCDRCHREVRFDIVFIPNLNLINILLQCGGHHYGVKNDADPGEIPEDLHGILDDLMQMEEMLCSLASPCLLMWVSKGGQYKTRGNVITFPQDITHLCTTLSRLPEHLDVLLIRKPDARTVMTPLMKMLLDFPLFLPKNVMYITFQFNAPRSLNKI